MGKVTFFLAARDRAGLDRAAAAAPTWPHFFVTPEQMREFREAGEAMPNDERVVLPFPQFAVCLTDDETKVLVDVDVDVDTCHVRNLHRCAGPMPGAVLAARTDIGIVDGMISIDAITGGLLPEMPEALAEEHRGLTLSTIMAIFGMLYLLDHRGVRIVDTLPVTRQQRRAAIRAGAPRDCYEIRIAPEITISEVADDLRHGRKRRHKRAHDRRAHLRAHPTTKLRTVRVKSAHVRGGRKEDSLYPIYRFGDA